MPEPTPEQRAVITRLERMRGEEARLSWEVERYTQLRGLFYERQTGDCLVRFSTDRTIIAQDGTTKLMLSNP